MKRSGIVLAVYIGLSSCGRAPDAAPPRGAKSPEAWREAFAKAWSEGDAEAVASLVDRTTERGRQFLMLTRPGLELVKKLREFQGAVREKFGEETLEKSLDDSRWEDLASDLALVVAELRRAEIETYGSLAMMAVRDPELGTVTLEIVKKGASWLLEPPERLAPAVAPGDGLNSLESARASLRKRLEFLEDRLKTLADSGSQQEFLNRLSENDQGRVASQPGDAHDDVASSRLKKESAAAARSSREETRVTDNRKAIEQGLEDLVDQRERSRNGGDPETFRVAFVGVTCRLNDDLRAWCDEVEGEVESVLEDSGTFESLLSKTDVQPALEKFGVTLETLVIPSHRRRVAATLEIDETPVDQFLLATVSPGKTRRGEATYALVFELMWAKDSRNATSRPVHISPMPARGADTGGRVDQTSPRK